MCTTNLCMAFYVLSFVVVGWTGALVLIIGKSSIDQGNNYVINPLAKWINIELINPARCFRAEIIKPLLREFKVGLNEWNQIVGSKPEVNF